MTIRTATMTTPDGPFSVLIDDDAVIASGWTPDVATLVELVHPEMRPALADVTDAEQGDPAMDAALAAVAAFYDGDVTAPSEVPVRQLSGEFRRRAWEVLRDVPAGEPITYTDFAARSGSPAAVRAAAAACAKNATALFVPCHRVLRSDGTLGGFRYGLDLKRRLLERETNSASFIPAASAGST